MAERSNGSVEIVEVGPRDGFQSVPAFIPTARKIALIEALHRAGVRRFEATSFVNAEAVPQLADAAAVLEAAQALPDADPQVLVPTARHADRALSAGARHLAFVLSVSTRHNQSNVRRSPEESAAEYARVVELLPPGAKLRLNLATAFDCPYEGPIAPARTLALLDWLVAACPTAEIALCDTTGRANPAAVGALFAQCQQTFPHLPQWALHAHDTYGLAAANVWAAWQAGIRIFDASIAGLGGCPFAPGATGNVASEDLVWLFESAGIATGISLAALVATAREVAALRGAQTGGRVRDALTAAQCEAA